MVRKFYEADGDNAYGFNTSSSLPSGGRTFEQILEDYHVQLEDNRRDESIKLAAEKYASQYAHQQPVQGYSREDIIALLDWLTKEDSPYAVCYGSETRFATNQDDLTTEQVFEVWNKIYGHIQQPVNDGWVMVEKEKLEKLYLIAIFDSYNRCNADENKFLSDTESVIYPKEPPKQTV